MRTTRERDAVGTILLVLALGLALRLIIAYLLPGSGFKVDLASFLGWSNNLASEGPFGFYDRPFFHDYTPGYLYVLWLAGSVNQWLAAAGISSIGPWTAVDILKIPPVLADLALGWLVWSMALELGAGRRAARIGALLVVLNPVSWFDSVVWGQVDSFGVVFLLLGLRELWRDRPERAAVLTVIGAIIKPQLGILIPIVAAVTIRRALWPDGAYGADGPPTPLRSDWSWERRIKGQVRIWTTGLAGLATAVVISLPFGLLLPGLIEQIFKTAGGYPYVSVNAYNLWALATVDGRGIAENSGWINDAPMGPGEVFLAFGPIPAVLVGSLLLVAVFAAVSVRVAWRPDRRTILVGLAVLALAFFVVPTRVHERYLFPLFAIAAILAASSWRWRAAYLIASAAVFANMYVVLTTLYPDNPGVADWLGIGSQLRSWSGVASAALAVTGVFLFALTELRTRALTRLEDEISESMLDDGTDIDWPTPATGAIPAASGAAHALAFAPEPKPETTPAAPGAERPISLDVSGRDSPAVDAPAGPAAGPAAGAIANWREPPTVIQAGYGGWLRSRLFERPIRPDRSRSLAGEPRGRLDRLDLWIVLVLVASVLTLRVWRLAEPYQMHFDEVYHARTATEFLQDWRYDLDHDIYEWTHPHLAKYAMAAGLVAWGNDRVTATSNLGAPVSSVALEPRWDPSSTLGARSGDRVYVATGDGVIAFDLATRERVAVLAIPGAAAVAVDTGRHQLWIGTSDGALLAADTLTLDEHRRREGTGGPAIDLVPEMLANVDGAFAALFAGSDGEAVIGRLADDRVVTFSADDGSPRSVVTIPGAGQMAAAGSGQALVIRPAEIRNPGAAALLLSDIVGGTPAELQDLLSSDRELTFLPRVPTGDKVAQLEAALADGRLAGVEQRQVRRIAVAGSEGLTFLDANSGQVVSTLDVGGSVDGVSLITGVDKDRLYVAVDGQDGPRMVVVMVSGDQARDGPARDREFPLPGRGGWVGYDDASQMVHVQGAAADGEGSTVYVIEPHANSVFADASLPFSPVALAMDANQRYPSTDRQALLAFHGDGSVASVDVGSHAFAWRLPGVIAGALLALLIYLLARILFRRREVAVLAGLLVLADGMLFAQSRIAMNDSYVATLILAAYVVFAAIWAGRRQGWWGFWIGMPIIGILLGLALSAKWVAAYAIGALGILILTRSALGRLVLIAGMIAATGILGYMAILVPEGAGSGNLLFLAIMTTLTAIAVVTTVVHPIAWSWEEHRLAVLTPGALGTVVILASLAVNMASTPLTFSSIQLTPLELGFALILASGLIHGLFLLAGRRGLGPMAPLPAPDGPPPRLPPPAPAAEGWLRPGAFLGVPVVWMLVCLLAIPLGVYVLSYVPWALIQDHQLWPGWPAGNDGQTLLALTEQMYRYHNTLTAAHAASSPWWAWPFDFKPVWFYQESFAGGISAAIYDAGNLVAWWLAIPALAFVAWQAFRRQSVGLALIAIGFACQWIAWSRIDRASFQYHYYTSLPFVLLALAYFLAELWHGASRRTWLLARVAGAAIVAGPMLLWLFHRPLCGLVNVEAVYANSPSCPTLIPEMVVSGRALLLAVVVGLGLLVILRQFASLGSGQGLRSVVPLVVAAGITMTAQVAIAALVPDEQLFTLRGIPVEPIAVVMLLPLLALAAAVLVARDARRFVIGVLLAAGAWFVLFYPNISGLPLPSPMFNAYQGILPTYVYTFQFPVNTVDRNVAGPGLISPEALTLAGALALTMAALAYSTWNWRLALAHRQRGPEPSVGPPGQDAPSSGADGDGPAG